MIMQVIGPTGVGNTGVTAKPEENPVENAEELKDLKSTSSCEADDTGTDCAWTDQE
jgi:hypothetical protein